MDVLRRLAMFADVADIRHWNHGDDAIISEWGIHDGIRATLTLGDARYAREFIRRIDENKTRREAAKTQPKKAAFGD